jgi:hypothetical protein
MCVHLGRDRFADTGEEHPRVSSSITLTPTGPQVFTVGSNVETDTWERAVHAETQAPNDPVKDEAKGRLRELETALTARGFTVRVEETRWSLVAVNKAVEPDDPRDPLAIAYGSTKLVQRVALATDATGALCWFWQWSGPTRDAPSEYEPLGPAAGIADAADRITRVLALAGQG